MGLLDRLMGNKTKPEKLQHVVAHNANISNCIRIINDSIKIINSTKSIETAISRFDVLKVNLEQLFDLIPTGQTFELKIGGKNLRSINDIQYIDELKSQWLSENGCINSSKEIAYSNALAEWGKKFNQVISDGIITEDELEELDSLKENLGLSEKDTAVYWKKCKIKLPVSKEENTVIDFKELESIGSKDWTLQVSFGSSKSSVFNLVISSVSIHPSYKVTQDKSGYDVHGLTLKAKDVPLFNELWSRIKTWKSTVVKINGEIIDNKSLSKMLLCCRDKFKTLESNKLFCYGASPFTFNLFGCHRTMLRDGVIASQKCWYHIGVFDNKNIFHVDKKAIAAIMLKNISPYRICPVLNIETLKKGLDLLPETINPAKDKNWQIQNDYMGNRFLMPTPIYNEYKSKTITETVGNMNISIASSISMIDYYASISPQFNELLKTLISN